MIAILSGLPLLGYAPFFGPNPQHKFLKFKEKYGKIFSMYMGTQLTIVLNDYSAVKEAFITQGEIFSGRAAGFVFEYISRGKDGKIHGKNNLIFLKFVIFSLIFLTRIFLGQWRKSEESSSLCKSRFSATCLDMLSVAAALQILQTFRDLGMGKDRMQNCILEEAETLIEIFRANAGKPFDPLPTFNASVANVICGMSWGRRYSHDDKRFQKVLSGFKVIPDLLSQASPLLGFPFLRFIPGTMKNKWDTALRAVRFNQNFTREVVLEHIQEKHEGEPRDFVDTFVNQQRAEEAVKIKTKEDKVYEMEELQQDLGTFFGAGVETTSTSLYWAILYMAHFPEIQKRVQREITENTPAGFPVKVEDRSKLPYVEAVIREIQRCANVTPFGILRCNLEETTLFGYRIPKKSTIMVNYLALNQDPTLWDEPEKFKPERFLNKEGKIHEPPYFMPFSVGKRACIGESLARMEIFLFSANILKNFDILPCPSSPLPSLDEYTTGISCRPTYYKIQLSARN
ncbi:hypothetical protein RvY_10925-1 [Ramazzottius varieornatus]|uniref:Uncharacterized protein n=1 Tax=Ramazzottius varieornatus TaxID=947166 RepID=A0A1D1VJU1_RAMVA|nr:hypothetical protein RvY_10925-1 [Ramazzottius varieornatus]